MVEPGTGFIGIEGLKRLYDDLEVSMEDPITIILPYYCAMKGYVLFDCNN